MTRAVLVHRPPITRSLGMALSLLGAAMLVIVGVQLAFAVTAVGGPMWVGVLVVATGLVYAAAGMAAWWRRPGNRLGSVMVVGALIWMLTMLGYTLVPALAAVGVVLATLPLAVVVHLLHAFPAGRLRSRLSRRTVLAGYAVCLVLQIPLYLWVPAASPGGMLAVADRPALALAGKWVQVGAGMTVMVVTAIILAGRLRGAAPRERRVLGPVHVYGIGVVIGVPLVPEIAARISGPPATLSASLQIGLLAGAPVVFACAMLMGGFARTSEIEELGAWLSSPAGARLPLADALAHALGDESVQLAFWMPDHDTYVDGAGRPVALPDDGSSGRGTVDVEVADRRVATIVYDATLIDDPEFVRAAGQVIAIAAEQQRLTAELSASQQQLRTSRARIVEAGDRERHRIAQDLHDGLQAELVLLAVEAQRLADLDGTTALAAQAAAGLRARIDQAAAGLRELVYAVMPAPLIERGLAAATEDLIDRMPVPTRLDLVVPDEVPAPVQSTAYFLIAEALSNAVKHAQASKIEVRVVGTGPVLVLQVDDDGIGGAHMGAGLGLRGLADRIDALGGRLRIVSRTDAGTHIEAELPCAI